MIIFVAHPQIDQEMTTSDKNLFDNLICDSPNKNIFGSMEDSEERILDKIEYANNKYIEFKAKMRYFKERQNKQKFKQYMKKLGKQNGFDKNIDISPYHKAMMKEEARKKFQLVQKNECMTQRAFKNFQNSLKNFDSTYHPGEFSMVHNTQYGKDSIGFGDSKTKQKVFLTIKGEKKNIETDATLINNK